MKTDHIITMLKNNRDMCIETLRIYLGIGLILKGLQFLFNHQLATEYMNRLSLPFFDFLSIHLIVVIHLAGGFLLAIGLITRIAALIQVPLLFGAIFFVHMQQGLFSKEQSLEFVILVLFLLLIFSVYGGGRLSVDYYLEKRKKRKIS
ncbi:MAG: DoxX family protein [Myxococcales bacterium]|nr:DoxX family protein [Myxococcales bacterium]USN50115.1 MAG: DoxX family protein [Myxococcales bacterium]